MQKDRLHTAVFSCLFQIDIVQHLYSALKMYP